MQTTFDITVGELISSQLNGRQDKSFDNGQGGVVSIDWWIVSQDITNKALDQCPVKAFTICIPETGEVKMSKRSIFTNDLSQMAGSNTTTNSPSTNIKGLWHITQQANNKHWELGGSFAIYKCSFRSPTTTNRGQPINHPTAFAIQPTPLSAPEEFQQKMINTLLHMLGIHIIPDRHPCANSTNSFTKQVCRAASYFDQILSQWQPFTQLSNNISNQLSCIYSSLKNCQIDTSIGCRAPFILLLRWQSGGTNSILGQENTSTIKMGAGTCRDMKRGSRGLAQQWMG